MNYNINLGEWNSVFAVPAEIVDTHLKSANAEQLKVILWVLRHCGQQISLQGIEKSLSIDTEKIKEVITYWKNLKVLSIKMDEILNNTEFNNQPKIQEVMSSPQNECSAYKKEHKIPPRYMRPDSLYIASRIKSSSEIYFLMQEAQVALGRPISHCDSAILLGLHDNDSLPVDVILMLLHYAVSVGKGSLKYIEKVGASWAHEGIDTHEKAEKKILSLNKLSAAWRKFENIIGIDHRAPTAAEEEAAGRWISEWNYSDELIKEAYDRCVNASGKYVLKYMDSIIIRWHNQGVNTIEQALTENQKINRRPFNNAGGKGTLKNAVNSQENYSIMDELKKYEYFINKGER